MDHERYRHHYLYLQLRLRLCKNVNCSIQSSASLKHYLRALRPPVRVFLLLCLHILRCFVNYFKSEKPYVERENFRQKSYGFFLQVAVYFLVHYFLFSGVRSRSVHVDQSSHRRTYSNGLIGPSNQNISEDLKDNLTTELIQSEANDGHVNFASVLQLRLKRTSLSCVETRRLEWNNCLGRYFSKIKCKIMSVACLSANNVPPKCMEQFEILPGRNGRPCKVLKSCSCAA